jgi:pyrroline-5-carboxylate reductase
MGEALTAGLIAAGWDAGELVVVEKVPDRREALVTLAKERSWAGLQVVPDPTAAEGAVVAVKPGDAGAACAALAGVGVRRVLSIAAGVPLRRLQEWLPGVAVIRAMPNTPALVGAGAAAVAAGGGADEADVRWAESILSAVGTVVRVPETLLDAVTGLSGSGPAYVFLVAEALIEAGVLVGLPRDVSISLVTQTLVGSAELLARSGESPEALRAAVTSPGGTTAAGIRALEQASVRAALLDAVAAATERSRELGREA